jgi:beta-lactamase class A
VADNFAHQPNLVLKTFVLARYLQDVERKRLSEDQQLLVDAAVRDVGSPVLLNLAGTTTARAVLEAMITHSDNTATDLAMLMVGAQRVRALIAAAGLQTIRIADSTRILASYLLGAPAGADFGWPGILHAIAHPPGPLRPPLNNVITLAGTARDFVSWYEQSLRGDFFSRVGTLVEFKRIQAMSEQIVEAIPADTPAYAKGGEVADFNGLSAKSFAGQMLVAGVKPVSFCFIVNWHGPSSEFPAIQREFFVSIKAILTIVKRMVQP